MAPASCCAVVSTSTSSKTTAAPLPPSSSLHGTRLRPQASPIFLPTSGDPVNDIRLIFGWFASAAPAFGPSPITTLSTPSGRPASAASFPTNNELSGVTSDGLTTTVLPAASAGAMPHNNKVNGKFHGKINPHTPYGARWV